MKRPLLILALGCLVAAPAFADTTTVTGFEIPESVLHDTIADVYLVSNVGSFELPDPNAPSGPGAFDHNGSISRVLPSGTVTHGWIKDGTNGVTLNGPKGMGIHGDVLYVADIDTLRLFNRVTGLPIGAIAFPNPFGPGTELFLNDVTITSNGTVFVSDNDNNAIFKVNPAGKVSLWSSDPALGSPNGLVAEGTNGVAWVQWSGPGQICRMGANRKVSVIGSISSGDPLDPGLYFDGLVLRADGSFLVSSWLTGAVYHVSATGAFMNTVAQFGEPWELGPADIGFDHGRNRLLVPVFFGGVVVIQDL